MQRRQIDENQMKVQKMASPVGLQAGWIRERRLMAFEVEN
jgi:hypothetical protein